MTHEAKVFIPWMSTHNAPAYESKPLELVIEVPGGHGWILRFDRGEWLRLLQGIEVVNAELDWEEDAA